VKEAISRGSIRKSHVAVSHANPNRGRLGESDVGLISVDRGGLDDLREPVFPILELREDGNHVENQGMDPEMRSWNRLNTLGSLTVTVTVTVTVILRS